MLRLFPVLFFSFGATGVGIHQSDTDLNSVLVLALSHRPSQRQRSGPHPLICVCRAKCRTRSSRSQEAYLGSAQFIDRGSELRTRLGLLLREPAENVRGFRVMDPSHVLCKIICTRSKIQTVDTPSCRSRPATCKWVRRSGTRTNAGCRESHVVLRRMGTQASQGR